MKKVNNDQDKLITVTVKPHIILPELLEVPKSLNLQLHAWFVGHKKG